MVEQEIANIMKAIKAGIFTVSTKAELERGEVERTRLQEAIKGTTAKADKVVTLLPGVHVRYEVLVQDLGGLSRRNVAQAREHVRELVGEIRLGANCGRYLVAEMTGGTQA